MSMFDLTVDRSFSAEPEEADERAVGALLKSPAITYLRDLRRLMEQDPNYLSFHDRSVGLRIQSLLSKEGIFWDEEVFERQFFKLVAQAIARLKHLET